MCGSFWEMKPWHIILTLWMGGLDLLLSKPELPTGCKIFQKVAESGRGGKIG